jgi:predicted glycosyltransferase
VERLNDARILIYSHDSFGLGHLRRCRAIAHAVVERFKGVSVLILSGSPIIGSFDFRSRVDFVRIPGVIKLSDGEYQSLGCTSTSSRRWRCAPRSSGRRRFFRRIFHRRQGAARAQRRGRADAADAESAGHDAGARPARHHGRAEAPAQGMEAQAGDPALEHLYDEIWVYGLESFANPLAGVACPVTVRDKILYTGYLRRAVPQLTEAMPFRSAEIPTCSSPSGRRRRHVGRRLGAARL